MSEQKKAMNMNVSNTLHSIRSLYKLLYSYGDRDTQNTVKLFKMERLQKEYNA